MEVYERVIGERQAMERELGHAIWAVDDKTTGAFIGQCGLRPIDEGAGPEIEIAYHYTKVSWGKGYGTEAAIAVVAHGFGPVCLERIVALALPDNVGSWRIMEKVGLRYEGLVNYFGLDGLKKYVGEKQWWSPPSAP